MSLNIFLNPDHTPGAVESGYRRQNINMIAARMGLDTTEPYENERGSITVPKGGIVEVDGRMYMVAEDTNVPREGNGEANWLVVVAAADKLTARLEAVTRPGAWNPEKRGCYFSSGEHDGGRTLNWVSTGKAADLPETDFANANVNVNVNASVPGILDVVTQNNSQSPPVDGNATRPVPVTAVQIGGTSTIMVWRRRVKGRWAITLRKGWYAACLVSGAGGVGTTAEGLMSASGSIAKRRLDVIFFHEGREPIFIKVGGDGFPCGNDGIGIFNGSGGGGNGSGEETTLNYFTTGEQPAGTGSTIGAGGRTRPDGSTDAGSCAIFWLGDS